MKNLILSKILHIIIIKTISNENKICWHAKINIRYQSTQMYQLDKSIGETHASDIERSEDYVSPLAHIFENIIGILPKICIFENIIGI